MPRGIVRAATIRVIRRGQMFCLVDAPSPDAATTVHREAHGMVADDIFPVEERS